MPSRVCDVSESGIGPTVSEPDVHEAAAVIIRAATEVSPAAGKSITRMSRMPRVLFICQLARSAQRVVQCGEAEQPARLRAFAGDEDGERDGARGAHRLCFPGALPVTRA